LLDVQLSKPDPLVATPLLSLPTNNLLGGESNNEEKDKL
jgi:hypothetical protein